MDRSSAVFENFEKKMAAMSGGPKINKNTFKVGSSLAERVGNNERKITILKNTFKAHRNEIGNKLKPQVNTLQQSLLETTSILGEISEKLQLDYSERLAEQKRILNQQRKDDLNKKRDAKEKKLEALKSDKFTKRIAKSVIAPVENIFDKILNLGLILGGGLLGTNLVKRLSDDETMSRLESIFDFISEYGKYVLGLFGIYGGWKVWVMAKKIWSIGSFVFSFIKGIVTGPAFPFIAAMAGYSWFVNRFLSPLMKKNQEVGQRITEKSLMDMFLENNPNATKEEIEAERKRIETLSEGAGYLDFNNLGIVDPTTTTTLGKVYSGQGDPQTWRETWYHLSNLFRNRNSDTSDIPGGEFDLQKFVNQITDTRNLALESNLTTFEVLPDIDLTNPKLNTIGGDLVNPATGVDRISSMNMSNSYMVETPEQFGFKDIIYS